MDRIHGTKRTIRPLYTCPFQPLLRSYTYKGCWQRDGSDRY